MQKKGQHYFSQPWIEFYLLANRHGPRIIVAPDSRIAFSAGHF